jgi:hypothetical protein
MHVAVSILSQLRDQLLVADFTNSMLVFSDLSEISVDTCIIDSIRSYKITPPSILNPLDEFQNSLHDITTENTRVSIFLRSFLFYQTKLV